MSLYAVKNDKGEWLYSDEYNDWVDQISQATFYDTFEDADDDIEGWELSNAYIVELTESPEKVVVSEEEAEMLKRLKSREEYPAKFIHRYIYDSHNFSEWDYDREIRLMRAYVNGWTVEKTKRWNVKVPHAKTLIYYKFEDVDDLGVAQSDSEGSWVEFTAEEIEHYGLGDCQKVVCADSARTTGEVTDDGIC